MEHPEPIAVDPAAADTAPLAATTPAVNPVQDVKNSEYFMRFIKVQHGLATLSTSPCGRYFVFADGRTVSLAVAKRVGVAPPVRFPLSHVSVISVITTPAGPRVVALAGTRAHVLGPAADGRSLEVLVDEPVATSYKYIAQTQSEVMLATRAGTISVREPGSLAEIDKVVLGRPQTGQPVVLDAATCYLDRLVERPPAGSAAALVPGRMGSTALYAAEASEDRTGRPGRRFRTAALLDVGEGTVAAALAGGAAAQAAGAVPFASPGAPHAEGRCAAVAAVVTETGRVCVFDVSPFVHAGLTPSTARAALLWEARLPHLRESAPSIAFTNAGTCVISGPSGLWVASRGGIAPLDPAWGDDTPRAITGAAALAGGRMFVGMGPRQIAVLDVAKLF